MGYITRNGEGAFPGAPRDERGAVPRQQSRLICAAPTWPAAGMIARLRAADLLGAGHANELAHAQYASAHRLATELPADADVFPTHGFGSFCSAAQSEGAASTIGAKRAVNPTPPLEEDSYVAGTLAGLDAYPAYCAHMVPANAAGPTDHLGRLRPARQPGSGGSPRRPRPG